MAKIPTTITSNGSYRLGTVNRNRDYESWQGLFFAYGSWGAGTLSWQWSPDGGTTLLAMKDLGGNAVTSAANDSFNSQFCTGRNNSDQIQLWVTLSGAASPSLTVGFYDNN